MSSIWLDPLLPKLKTPTAAFLRENPLRFGRLGMKVSQSQWEYIFAPETFLGWVGGVRSGKTVGAVGRSLKCSLFIPENRGIFGRLTQTDLQDTDQRDLYEYAETTGMVKRKNDRKLELYCCDHEGRILPGKPTSEILCLHFDNPSHLKGQGVGWWYMAEASEMHVNAMYRLTDRLSHPAAKGRYTGFLTSNPEGRNWVWNHFYNPATVEALPMADRLMRRAIHNRTKDNPFLTEEYLRMQYATSPPDWIRRYMDGEFDVFEGQIFGEFSHEIHCVNSFDCAGWEKHEPPKHWPRYMGIDTGGTDPWAFEVSAVDPYGNVIFYDEIYRPETDVTSFEKPLNAMLDGRNLESVPMDYENKVAQEELRRIGIRVKNAYKRDKVKKSFHQVARYLHPNPERAFPDWHPKAGQPGSPGLFFTERVPNMVRELPQQRWKKLAGTDISLNEPDSRVSDHAVSALYYTLRERPRPEEALKPLGLKLKEAGMDLQSVYYHLLEKQHEEEMAKRQRVTCQPLPPLRVAPKTNERPLWR
jgi:hypothetical protein